MRSVLASAVLLGLLASQPASAGFIGSYDVTNWTPILTGIPPGGGTPAIVDTTGAPGAVTLIGGIDGCFTVVVEPCTVQFTVTALDDELAFHWDFITQTDFGVTDDQFGYLINTSRYQLTDDDGPALQSGDAVVHLNPGDSFGFYLDCQICDSIFGAPPGAATISAFAVPEPSTIALLGIGLLGLGLARRRSTARRYIR